MAEQSTQEYAWPTWWGAVAKSDQPPGIVGLARKVRASVGGLKANKQTGVAFPVKSAKDLMAKLRAALDEHGGYCWVVGQEVKDIATERGTACMVQSKVRLAAADGSFVDFVGVGHGADSQDKASGKASTYAWKDALCKGLDLPDAEMVDTDDSDEPVPGGVKLKKGKTVKALEDTVTLDMCQTLLRGCKTPDGVRELMKEWRTSLPPDLALKVGPLAKQRITELS